MKIAIFHNFLDNIGGAEICDLIMARELGADIYTTNIDHEKIKKMGFDSKNIYSIGKIPIHPPFRQEIAYWKFRNFKLKKKYDFYIIAGDWAMGAALHNKPNFWYVYSPMREIFDLHSYTRAHAMTLWKRPLFDLWVYWRRFIITRDAKNIDNIVSISKIVQARVFKYLQRDSKIIYPPVETNKYHYEKNGNFWLSVNRLITHKRVMMQLDAFKKLPNERLIIVGSYEKAKHFQNYAENIKAHKPANVEIISWVSSEKLRELYATCKGFITTPINEDFGLTVVEAMASGKPVIAPNSGGYKESVVNGATGDLIDNITAEKIVDAVLRVGKNPSQYKDACISQAKKFDTKVFIEKIQPHILKNKK